MKFNLRQGCFPNLSKVKLFLEFFTLNFHLSNLEAGLSWVLQYRALYSALEAESSESIFTKFSSISVFEQAWTGLDGDIFYKFWQSYKKTLVTILHTLFSPTSHCLKFNIHATKIFLGDIFIFRTSINIIRYRVFIRNCKK